MTLGVTISLLVSKSKKLSLCGGTAIGCHWLIDTTFGFSMKYQIFFPSCSRVSSEVAYRRCC